MVVRRRKKYTKYLGKRYARRGYNDRNRGAGNRGGRGFAGWKSKKQKYIKLIKEFPERFEDKKGFTPPIRKKIYSINLDEIFEGIEEWKALGLIKTEENKLVINLLDLGYDKLLGRGNINIPVKIITKYASKKAIKKVEEAGGEVVLVEAA